MSGLYTPNVALSTTWRAGLSALLSTLRKVKFVAEWTFEWGDFNPQTSFNGMTVQTYEIRRARYLNIYKFLWFSVDIGFEPTAGLTNRVTLYLPEFVKAAGTSSQYQAGGARIDNASTAEAGTWAIAGTTNSIDVYRTTAANYAATLTRIFANGVIEIV